MVKKKNKISLALQALYLKKRFPNSVCIIASGNTLIWEGDLTPKQHSNNYKVRVVLNQKGKVRVYVVEPKLQRYNGDEYLPHVYSTSEQRLCLFYPGAFQWLPSKLLIDTIIPWACEWLLFYELWLITGKWLGGGIGHKDEAEKNLIENGESTEDEIKQKSLSKHKK